MSSKMTTNSQLSTTKPKRKTLSKQLEQEQNHKNGDQSHGGLSARRRSGGMGEKVQGIRNLNGRYK